MRLLHNSSVVSVASGGAVVDPFYSGRFVLPQALCGKRNGPGTWSEGETAVVDVDDDGSHINRASV